MALYIKNKLQYGFGINDADYNVYVYEYFDGKRKMVWYCPFFQVWKNMVRRCYNKKTHVKWPTYAECTVAQEWKYFSKFKSWMEQQDWEGKHIDKDILSPGNKVYSPETCVFVTPEVNMFLTERQNHRGSNPIGANWDKNSNKFKAQISVSGGSKHLGLYETAEEAHKAWLQHKIKLAYSLSELQTDQRVAKALIDKYENYDKQSGVI